MLISIWIAIAYLKSTTSLPNVCCLYNTPYMYVHMYKENGTTDTHADFISFKECSFRFIYHKLPVFKFNFFYSLPHFR